jgi:CHAT domain-containing protein/tetratricopeptide (TPR) repeat protein
MAKQTAELTRRKQAVVSRLLRPLTNFSLGVATRHPITFMIRRSLQLLIQTCVVLLICIPSIAAQNSNELPKLTDVERELKGGETHAYRITLAAGQFLYATVEQKDIDLIAASYAPDGKEVSACDSPNDRWGFESILLVAERAGDYRIEVQAPNKKAPAGRYRIHIVALREATAVDRGHAAALVAFEEGATLRSKQNANATRAAIEKYQQALTLFRAADDNYSAAMTLQSIGIAYYPLNEFRKGLDCFNQTLALAVELKDKRLEAGTETWTAGMLDILGDVSSALVHYEHALKLAREGGWRLAEGSALASMGKIYSDIAEWQKALELYSQALPIFTEVDSKQDQAITLNNIGITYDLSGEYQKALDYLQQSLPLFRAVGSKNSEAYTLLNIGRVYRRLDDNEKALSYYNQAQTLQRATGNRAQEAETLDEIGDAYAARRDFQKALDYHQQAIEIQLTTGNARREAMARTKLGEVYSQLDQPEKAFEQFKRALATFRNIGDPRSEAIALEGSAKLEQKRGNLAEARKQMAESLSLIETVRARSGSSQLRASYRATVEDAFEFYIDLLMQQHAADPSHGYDAEALEASERGRARSLLEQLNESRVDIRRGVDERLLDKERELARDMNAKAQRELQLKTRKGGADQLAALEREISALEDQYQQVQAAIRQSSPQYAALTQPQPLRLKEIQQQLDPDTLLLEYSLGTEKSYLWVVAPDSLKTYVLPTQDAVEKLATRVYESLVARSVSQPLETREQRTMRIAQADSEFEKSAAELSRMVLSPAASELGNKRLVIVADGALQFVPFAALTIANRRPLIVDHEIVSLPSASSLAVQRQNLANRELAPKTLAVIADPVFSANDSRLKKGVEAAPEPISTRIIEHGPATTTGGQFTIPRLPFTRWEADQILAVARNGSNLKALDFRANRAIATGGELSKYRYVHFATHGYLDTTRAGLSAIVLSLYDEQGKPQDGFLRTHDVYNLKLPAELVVLSACETGLGKEVQGEGVEGLTRAFMYAGARRVVVSLWNVNDKATASLMQRLYAGMLRSNKTPAAALRAAQIEMLRNAQWQAPYYWAPFVMQGEWR